MNYDKSIAEMEYLIEKYEDEIKTGFEDYHADSCRRLEGYEIENNRKIIINLACAIEVLKNNEIVVHDVAEFYKEQNNGK